MRQLKDRRVLITGAGSGLGRALALKFASAGWRVACTDVQLDAATQTLREIETAGGTGLAFALNVTQENSFAAAAAQLQAAWGGVDVWVNNAGVASAGTVADSALDQWQWVLDINLLGCVRGARAAIPLLKSQGGGHIVNVASFAGIANPPAMASYNVSKAAVISLSETLRLELAGDGIGVSVACPSFFKTNLLATSQREGRGHSRDGGSAAPQMGRIVEKLMEKATVTAEDVAADIFKAVEQNRFLVITHPDARQRYHLKRIAPEMYYRAALKMTAKFIGR